MNHHTDQSDVVDLSRCSHCDLEIVKINRMALVQVTGHVINRKTKECREFLINFCGWQCLFLWQIDDFLFSPFVKIEESWKPVLKQFHDYLVKLGD